jgi:hypothetical protein
MTKNKKNYLIAMRAIVVDRDNLPCDKSVAENISEKKQVKKIMSFSEWIDSVLIPRESRNR